MDTLPYKRLTVVAPPELVSELRRYARQEGLAIYSDRGILKLKGHLTEELLDSLKHLPDESYQIYRAYWSGQFGREGYRSGTANAVRIRIRAHKEA